MVSIVSLRAGNPWDMRSGSRLLLLLLLPLLGALGVACGQGSGASCPTSDPNACLDATLSYDGGIGALLNERCSPCHAAGGVEAKILLTDYAHVSKAQMSISSKLVTCTMPPAGSPQLTDSERQQILGWLSCGGPQ